MLNENQIKFLELYELELLKNHNSTFPIIKQLYELLYNDKLTSDCVSCISKIKAKLSNQYVMLLKYKPVKNEIEIKPDTETITIKPRRLRSVDEDISKSDPTSTLADD